MDVSHEHDLTLRIEGQAFWVQDLPDEGHAGTECRLVGCLW